MAGDGQAMTAKIDIRDVRTIAPNFKRRLSGVTSTIVQLVPKQRELGHPIAALGPGLPEDFPRIRFRDLWRLWKPPQGARSRVWHARRNIEMLPGIIFRDILRMKLKLMFTSAAQRDHRAYTRWLIARMDHVVACNSRSGSYLKVPHDVILHGVDLDDFHPAAADSEINVTPDFPDQKLVGCFGRVRKQKGTDLFVRAMINLIPKYTGWTAVIAGRTTPEHVAFQKQLQKEIDVAGLEDRIVFLGEVDDIKPWYQRIDLYVAPSRNEGFGLTPLEAMASGTTVVASDAGAYQDIITPGKNGLIVPAGDGDALQQAIAEYLDDPDKVESQKQVCLDFVHAEFSLEREAASLIRLYNQLQGSA
jgi:mannosyltransferase